MEYLVNNNILKPKESNPAGEPMKVKLAHFLGCNRNDLMRQSLTFEMFLYPECNADLSQTVSTCLISKALPK